MVENQVPKCPSSFEELEKRKHLDNANKIGDGNGSNGTTEQLAELIESVKLIKVADSSIIAKNKKQMKVERNVCKEREHSATKAYFLILLLDFGCLFTVALDSAFFSFCY